MLSSVPYHTTFTNLLEYANRFITIFHSCWKVKKWCSYGQFCIIAKSTTVLLLWIHLTSTTGCHSSCSLLNKYLWSQGLPSHIFSGVAMAIESKASTWVVCHPSLLHLNHSTRMPRDVQEPCDFGPIHLTCKATSCILEMFIRIGKCRWGCRMVRVHSLQI